jgi:hypothetical protein
MIARFPDERLVSTVHDDRAIGGGEELRRRDELEH